MRDPANEKPWAEFPEDLEAWKKCRAEYIATCKKLENIAVECGELLDLLHPIDFESVTPDDEYCDQINFQINLVRKIFRD